MKPRNPWLGDAQGLDYLRSLAAGLRGELERRAADAPALMSLIPDVDRLLGSLGALRDLGYSEGMQLLAGYRSLAVRKASILNEAATVSRVYPGMDEFWADAEAQARGESAFTFWDTYEHGRRRQLEDLLARAYGAESALLVNSGMSAIAVALGALRLRAGDVLVTGERCYFETSDYLEAFVEKAGIRVVRLALDREEEVRSGLERLSPRAFLFETATNAPDVTVPSGALGWMRDHPEIWFLVDNSVQSHLTRWCGLHERTIVLESAVKYITQECMAGVLYGSRRSMEDVRHHARATGQQLQEKVFNYIGEAEILALDKRMALHSRNARAFREELSAAGDGWRFIRTLDSTVEGDAAGQALFSRGVGALVFAALDAAHDGRTVEERHRRLLIGWQQRTRALGIELPVRAGFGWSRTTARLYESNRLNQHDAPSYLRVSVGLEPESVVRALARELGAASRALSRSRARVEEAGGSYARS